MTHLTRVFAISIFSICFFSFDTKDTFSKEDTDNIITLVSNYVENLTAYCGCGNENDALISKDNLLDLFINNGSSVSSYSYPADLLRGEEQTSFYNYLLLVAKNYHYKLKIDFSSLDFLNCAASSFEGKVAFVGMTKTLSINDTTKSVYEILAINLSERDAKIINIITPDEYENKDECFHVFMEKGSPKDINFKKWSAIGNSYYEIKDYINAKSAFEMSLKFIVDAEVQDKLSNCNEMINLNSYKLKAETALNEKRYFEAKEHYTFIVTHYPLDKELAQEKIIECNIGIAKQQFENQKQTANAYFEKEYFEKALTAYKICLELKPNDIEIQNKIRECSLKDSRSVHELIQKAIYLAEQKNDLASCFKILYSVEKSGLLTGKNYYFMAMMMDGRDQKIDKVMGFTKNRCNYLAVVYCKKAINLNDEDAKFMWRTNLIKKR